ncbi:MAG: DegV family protein [Acidimicrobiales bacterium]|jgi:DegV family protein with EDD domain|nr:DegV family protein [Acidimicrobiales bacterium]MDP6900798.1 DegV family protein [Acidimicrobiales bacterium]HJL99211.1 DegV family protein [Acidimicrobiales bacterium]
MTSVHIVTDSSCDLPDDLIAEMNIKIVPLKIRFGDTEFVDRVELTTDQFWEKCQISDELPSTAAPSPGAFVEEFQNAAREGATGVVAIILSGELSATIEAAQQAAQLVRDEIEVRVIDSRTVTLGLGSVVIGAAAAANSGASIEEVSAIATDSIGRTQVHAALDTLENLRKGGRIGAAGSLLGSMLSIKPLIEVRNGVVEPAGKQRTRGKALSYLVGVVEQNADQIDQIFVTHAACDDVDSFLEQVRSVVNVEVLVGQVGPVVGAHAGIGTIGVAFQTAN